MKLPNRNKAKPGKEALLPNRQAMNQLLKGPPGDKTILDYGALTPSGAAAPQTYPQLIQMGLGMPKRTG